MVSEEDDMTALMCACERGNVDVVRLLVDRGASINHVGARGTALTRACEGGHLDVIQFLIENALRQRVVWRRWYECVDACMQEWQW